MRVVFAGTPEVAVPALQALAASEHDVVLVVTRPDAPLGRKRVLTPSPVAAAAATLGLPVLRTTRLDDAATDRIAQAQADIGVIVAYGGLVREPLLSLPPFGWVNLHFSLLPRWRGAAPVQRALIAGDELGWAVFDLVAALDAGDVYVQEPYQATALSTAGEVLADLAEIGGERLPEIVTQIGAGLRPRPQHGTPTLAAKLGLVDGELPLQETAVAVFNRFRGVTPEPGAFVTLATGRLKLPAIAPHRGEHTAIPAGTITLHDGAVLMGTGTEPLELIRVQPAGKAQMPALDWWRGLRLTELQVTPTPAEAGA